MDIDDELRQLFTSDRLDVPVRADAEEIIVSGARRLRRRRIATATASGALAVVVVVTAGIALAGGDPDAMPPATTNPSTPPAATSDPITTLPSTSTAAGAPMTMSTTTTAPPPPSTTTRTSKPAPPNLDYPEIGPGGFQALKLGQSLEEARATGLVGDPTSEAEDTCESYPLLSDDVSGRVYITDTVQAIVADPVMTPEGVGPGWTVEQVSEVYSEAGRLGVSSDGRAIVPVPGNSSVVYVLKFSDGVVTSVSLAFADQSCY